jgi:hypothetical protein
MDFKDFEGKVCDTIRGMEVGSDDLTMTFTDGSAIHMEHYRDCCESVQIADVIGDPQDLLGVPMVMCEEAESGPYEPQPGYDSYTDVWYKFRTHNGDVTIRWRGESNGYYGERAVVTFTPPQK